MNSLIENWQNFRGLAYADELLIGLGAVLLIVSILKIVKSSAVMLFWVFLSGMGLAGISQGLDRNPLVSAATKHGPVADYLDTSKEISSDALGILCRKLEETDLLRLE